MSRRNNARESVLHTHRRLFIAIQDDLVKVLVQCQPCPALCTCTGRLLDHTRVLVDPQYCILTLRACMESLAGGSGILNINALRP
jgi:hypothetical protein